jgi:acyl-CoA synthetase (NDP forming)
MQDVVRRLDRALSPRVVAVVGDKKVSGYNWLKNQAKFTGKLYSVQIDPNEIPGIEELGIPNYKSLVEIPDEVDLVICAVPRQVAPRVVADAAAKKVGGIAMFTSGFAETGEELGVKLQDEILRIAREHDLLIVGPNCMGIYNARLGVRFSGDQPAGEGGGIGFISQSGTHAINTSLYASSQGLLLSKAISIGNAIVIDAADCLEYFAADPETKIIGLYVEGVRDGVRDDLEHDGIAEAVGDRHGVARIVRQFGARDGDARLRQRVLRLNLGEQGAAGVPRPLNNRAAHALPPRRSDPPAKQYRVGG